METAGSKRSFLVRSSVILVLLFSSVCLISSYAFSIPVYSFVFPVAYPRKSSNFGKRKHPVYKIVRNHSGVDLAAPSGTPIRAIASGMVIFADPHGGYGNFVVVKHKDEMSSHYGHLESMKVKPGEYVSAGQIIGAVGSTGVSTGPHLHFELRHKGNPLDPVKYLAGFDEEPQG